MNSLRVMAASSLQVRCRTIWVAAKSSAPWLVEMLVRDLFPLVKDAKLPFSALLTDFDVDELEQALGKGKTGT